MVPLFERRRFFFCFSFFLWDDRSERFSPRAGIFRFERKVYIERLAMVCGWRDLFLPPSALLAEASLGCKAEVKTSMMKIWKILFRQHLPPTESCRYIPGDSLGDSSAILRCTWSRNSHTDNRRFGARIYFHKNSWRARCEKWTSLLFSWTDYTNRNHVGKDS